MRISTLVSSTFGALLALAALTTSGAARAADEFDVSASGGKVVVTAKGAWHINKQFPWKLTVGDAKLDKGSFSLSDTQATVAAPSGSGTLKGALCNGDACKTFSVSVTL